MVGDALSAQSKDHAASILVVDDEKTIRAVVSEALENHGFRVSAAGSADQALGVCAQQSFDLVIADLRMPGSMDGMDLLVELHRRYPDTVVIMLTAFATLDSAISALRQGAYDYLVKPISLAQIIETVERGLAKRREEIRRRELITQLEETMQALKRESRSAQAEMSTAGRFVQTPTLIVDRQKRIVVRGNESIGLTATEFDLLDYLACNSDRVVTARELIRAVQGYDLAEADARPILRVHIQRLRQKLEEDSEHPRYILNVRGKGYRFTG